MWVRTSMHLLPTIPCLKTSLLAGLTITRRCAASTRVYAQSCTVVSWTCSFSSYLHGWDHHIYMAAILDAVSALPLIIYRDKPLSTSLMLCVLCRKTAYPIWGLHAAKCILSHLEIRESLSIGQVSKHVAVSDRLIQVWSRQTWFISPTWRRIDKDDAHDEIVLDLHRNRRHGLSTGAAEAYKASAANAQKNQSTISNYQ